MSIPFRMLATADGAHTISAQFDHEVTMIASGPGTITAPAYGNTSV